MNVSTSPQQRHLVPLALANEAIFQSLLKCDAKEEPQLILPYLTHYYHQEGPDKFCKGQRCRGEGRADQRERHDRERLASLSAQVLGACQPLQQVQHRARPRGRLTSYSLPGVFSLNWHRLLTSTLSTLCTIIDHCLSRGENRVHRGDSVVQGRSRHRKGEPRAGMLVPPLWLVTRELRSLTYRTHSTISTCTK